MRDPSKILTKQMKLSLESIKQFYIAIEKEEDKFETLIELYRNFGFLLINFNLPFILI